MLYLTITPQSGQAPKFMGYISTPMRIDPVNLTEVINIENTPTIKICEEWEIYPKEYVYWPSYLGKDFARITYVRAYKENYTQYFYGFDDGGSSTLPIFWEKLEKYLNLTEEELKQVKDRTKGYFTSGKIIDKKPDWSLVLEDLGDPMGVGTSYVGYEEAVYANKTRSMLNTYCLVVETEKENPSMVIQLLIDGDSDIQLQIDCSKRLDDPKALFIELFEYIGLPTSFLDSIELKENLLYMT
jgi:hypothetical protein